MRSLAVLLAAALTLLPPIALGHRTYDLVIGVEWSHRAHELLPHVVDRESPLPHTIDRASSASSAP